MERLKRAALILFTLFLSIPSFSFAQKKIAYIIGGAEPNKEAQTTVFDIDYYETVRVLILEGYEIHAYFNGETPGTVKNWINPLKKDSRVKWYPASKMEALEGLKKLTLGKDDKLVVYIIGHGSASEVSLQHGVIMNDDVLLRLSDLKPILDGDNLSKAKQIIFDSSCFSGHALVLSNPNRCVLASSHKDTQGYFAFPWVLKKTIEYTRKHGGPNSILDIYLRARPHMVASHPMISSYEPQSEALKALHFLTRYHLTIEEYMYFFEKEGFCDYCFIKTHDKHGKRLAEVMSSLSKIEIPLAKYDAIGLQTTAQEFVQVNQRLLQISNLEESKRLGLESEINELIQRAKSLHAKLVRFERVLYDIEFSKVEIPDSDPCKSMTL